MAVKDKTKKEIQEYLQDRYKKQNEHIKENYDRVSVTLPKGTKERIKEKGYSINGFIADAVVEKLDKDEVNNALQGEKSQEKDKHEEFTDRLNKESLEALYKEYGEMGTKDITLQLEIMGKYGIKAFEQYVEYVDALHKNRR